MSKNKSTYLYLALTILLWGAVPATAKLALRELNNLQLLLYNNAFAVVSLFPVVLFRGEMKLLVKHTKSDLLKMFGMGALGITFTIS